MLMPLFPRFTKVLDKVTFSLFLSNICDLLIYFLSKTASLTLSNLTTLRSLSVKLLSYFFGLCHLFGFVSRFFSWSFCSAFFNFQKLFSFSFITISYFTCFFGRPLLLGFVAISDL